MALNLPDPAVPLPPYASLADALSAVDHLVEAIDSLWTVAALDVADEGHADLDVGMLVVDASHGDRAYTLRRRFARALAERLLHEPDLRIIPGVLEGDSWMHQSDPLVGPPTDGATLTADQFAAVWNNALAADRNRLWRHIQANADAADRCVIENHAGRIEQLRDLRGPGAHPGPPRTLSDRMPTNGNHNTQLCRGSLCDSECTCSCHLPAHPADGSPA